MCIIVAKPMGVNLPSRQTLLNCFNNNSDGAGFMYANGKTVCIHKGFFDFDEFYETLLLLDDIKDTSIVMHFRISTHGGVNTACCHPFPVSDDLEQLGKADNENRVCVAHNGVIQGMKTSKGISDTMAYIMDVIVPIRRLSEDFMHNDNAIDLLRNTCGSKLCFLDNAGDIVTIGEFHEVDGVLFSNYTYAAKTYYMNSYARFWERSVPATTGTLFDDKDDFYSQDFLDRVDFSKLPFDSCMDCPGAEECFFTTPYCTSSHQADYESQSYLWEEVDDAEKKTSDLLL